MNTLRSAVAAAALCLFAAPAFSQDGPKVVRLVWKHAVGDRYKIKVNSEIKDSSTRLQARFEAELLVTEVDEKGRANGELRFSKINAIKSRSGSGVDIEGPRIKSQPVGFTWLANGRFAPAGSELKRFEDGIEEMLVDISLGTHLAELFLILPEKDVKVGADWKHFQDTLLYILKVEGVKDGKATVRGSPTAPGSDSEANGKLIMEFDIAHGYMTSYDQYHRKVTTVGELLSSTTVKELTRKIEVTKIAGPGATGSEPTALSRKVPARRQCPKCNKAFTESEKFCPEDGAKIETIESRRQCLRCNRVYGKDVKFCPEDGNRIQVMEPDGEKAQRCEKCAKDFGAGFRFCPRCGGKLTPKQ